MIITNDDSFADSYVNTSRMRQLSENGRARFDVVESIGEYAAFVTARNGDAECAQNRRWNVEKRNVAYCAARDVASSKNEWNGEIERMIAYMTP